MSDQKNTGRPRITLARVGKTLFLAVKDLFQDSGPQWAAAVAYYGLLSLFPLLLAAVSIAAYFIEPTWAIDQATRLIGRFLPGGETQIAEIVKAVFDTRGTGSLVSIGLLLWSGSRVFGVLAKALNVAYDVEETFGFFRRTVVELVTMLTVGLLFVITLVSRLAIRAVWQSMEFSFPGQDLFFNIVLQAVPGLLLLASFALVYAYVPRRKVSGWAALGGAVAATLLFLVARPLFLTYLNTFANFNLVYGAIAIVVVLLVWAWLVSLIVLLGGEIAAHIQAALVEGREVKKGDSNLVSSYIDI